MPKRFNTINAPVVPLMFSEFCALTACTLLGEIKQLEKVIRNATTRKKEIEEVLKLMSIIEKSTIASTFTASNDDHQAPTV